MKLTLPDTRFKGVFVSGGWELDIPDIEVVRSSPRYAELVTLFMRLGLPPIKAEDAAMEACLSLWRSIWRERVLKSVGRYAKKYADGHFGSLEGFDPARIARLWIPGESYFWLHGGNPLIRAEFAAMRREHDAS